MYYHLQYLFLLLLLGLLMPPSISESDNKMFLNCTSPAELPCLGDSLEIRYPFWSPNRSENCGHPGFNLTCSSDDSEKSRLMITLGGKEYQVNNIDYGKQLLEVVDPNFIGYSCPQSFTNTTLNFTLVNYAANLDLNLTFYLNCSPDFPFLPTLYKNITCLASDSGYYSYYRIPNEYPSPPLDLWGICSSIVLVPTYQIHANIPASNPNGFLDALQEGFGLTWTVGRRCGECEESGGVCGYNSSTPDAPTCFCPKATSASGTCVDGINANKNNKIIIGSVVGLVGFLLPCFLLVLYFRHRRIEFYNSIILWRKDVDTNQNIEAFLEKYGSLAPKRYKYSDLKKITNSFCDRLGQGGFGTVFKGTLNDGRAVAVKILSDSKGNGEEFFNEVASIGRTSHVNIVSLLGFCSEGSKRALIYDFMCNGSLEKFVYSEKPKTTLDWEKFYRIAIGIARGLEYLHRGCNTRIVHFDIKPHNILLDQDFCPKISDFGLAKLCLQKESIVSMTGTRGTIGYIAPEVFSRNFGVVSSKSDVYSYGMMVLEMAAGRKNTNAGVENSSEIYFPHWIYEHLDQNGDLQACGVTAENEEIARKMIVVGLWCIQTMPQNRPSISKVIEMLEGSINDLQVPPKPYLSSPLGPLMVTSSIHHGCWNDDSSSVHS